MINQKLCSLFLSCICFIGVTTGNEYTKEDIGYFWHFTDTHVQPAYYQDASVLKHCIEGKGTAGMYGSIDGPCDLPYKSLDSSFAFMNKQYSNPDFILYTGDMVYSFL